MGMFLAELLEDEELGSASEFKDLLEKWNMDLSTGALKRNKIPGRLWTWMESRNNYWFGYAGISAICRILEARHLVFPHPPRPWNPSPPRLLKS